MMKWLSLLVLLICLVAGVAPAQTPATPLYYAQNYGSCTWGTGPTNDAGPCVNSAVAAAATNNGGTVVLPCGTYNFSTQVVNRTSGVHFWGCGGGIQHDNQGSGSWKAVTHMVWNGSVTAPTSPAWLIQGMPSATLYSVDMQGIVVDCASLCGIAVEIAGVVRSYFDVGGSEANYIDVWVTTNWTPVSFTSNVSGMTSGTLSAAWTGASGTYGGSIFSDGTISSIHVVNGSANATLFNPAPTGSTVLAAQIAQESSGTQFNEGSLYSRNSTPGFTSTSSTISGVTLTLGGTVTGTVAVGQMITGKGVVPQTFIVSGGGSSWTISPSQTVSTATNINSMQAVGILIDTGTGLYGNMPYNVSLNHWHNLNAWYMGDGIVIGDSDNGLIDYVYVYPNGTYPGQGSLTSATGNGLACANSNYAASNGYTPVQQCRIQSFFHVGGKGVYDVMGFQSGSVWTPGGSYSEGLNPSLSLTTNASTSQGTFKLPFSSTISGTTQITNGMAINCGGASYGVGNNNVMTQVSSTAIYLLTPIAGTMASGMKCAFSYGLTNAATPGGNYTLSYASATSSYTIAAPYINTATFTTTLSSGATSGTLISSVSNGTYYFTFSNGEVRQVAVSGGTAVTWLLTGGALASAATAAVAYTTTGQAGIVPSNGVLTFNDVVIPWATGTPQNGDYWTLFVPNPSRQINFQGVDSGNKTPSQSFEVGASGFSWYYGQALP